MVSRTETITLVFTDIAGSTELANSLGHDKYEELRRHHFAASRAAVDAHHGQQIKSLGDGLMLAFASAADAAGCAVAIQQASCVTAERGDHLLQIRVGISSGEATREDQDLYGPPVVEASRLCAVAAPGQILASDVVRLLARGKGLMFFPVGELTLKGIPDPVAACEVKWEPPRDTRRAIPMPLQLAAQPATGLFGREKEQATLMQAWAAVQAGERRVVLLGGEPGIGKTRLAAEFARKAHQDGGIVLFGACDEDLSLPYRPFMEGLRHFVAHAPDHILATHVRTHQAELTRLVPELRERIAGLPIPQVAEAETKRFLMFEAVLGLLSVAAKETPILLVLDDLQWAGVPDLLLLKHLLKSASPLRLLIVVTFRDTDLSADHPLTPMLADWHREAGIERVALGGIDEMAVAALLAATAGHELSQRGRALASALHNDTEGSPFFITAILQSFNESGVLFREDDRWTFKGKIADLGIPKAVKDVITRRLRRLPDVSNKVLALAAVVGRQFDFGLLAIVARRADAATLDEDAVLDAIERALAASLIGEVPGARETYSFSHALIRSTLYDELSAPRRRQMHRKVAESLEVAAGAESDARIGELAHHWLASADSRDNAKAIAYARRAAERSAAELGFEAAASFYERALGVLAPATEEEDLLKCELLSDLGGAQRSAGDARFRATMASAAEIARRRKDGRRLAVAALGSGHPGGVQWENAVDASLVSLYSEGLAALGDSEDLLRARLLGQLAAELKYGPERQRRHELSRQAVDIARRSGDRQTLAYALTARLFAIEDPSTLVDRLPMAAELESLAALLGSNQLGCLAARQRFVALLESGDAVGAERALMRCEQLAKQLRVPFFDCFARFIRTMFSLMQGAPDSELQILNTFQAGIAIGLPQARLALGSQMFELRARQGLLPALLDTIRAGVASHPNVFTFRAGLVFSLCETGAFEEARAQMGVFAANGFALPLDMNWSGAVSLLSDCCAALRDTQASEILYPMVRPFSEQVGVTAGVRCDGSLARPAGLLAACLERWAEAETHFEHALMMNERIGAKPAVVQTHRAFAAMLLARARAGDAKRAADLITKARPLAAALEMKAESDKLTDLSKRLPA